MQIDLSSDRVRLGLHLLDGVRAGQPLGALLGYRLERSLHDGGLDPFIDDLRALAPLTIGAPGRRRRWPGAAAQVPQRSEVLVGAGTPGRRDHGRDQLAGTLGRLDDALDAVADLSPVRKRAPAGYAATPSAPAPPSTRSLAATCLPPELDVVRTPRAGTALTHRLFAIAVDGQRPAGPPRPARRRSPG